MKTSVHLTLGAVYSRDDLKARFSIVDATINTGVFRPRGHDSIWLFVTEHKTSDRTQYADRLESESLFWQGQMSGRSDPTIIQHAANGLELLLFFRRKKYDFPKAGFRFAGIFNYVSHFGSHPTSFLLHRVRQDADIRYSQPRDVSIMAVHQEQADAKAPPDIKPDGLADVIAWLAGGCHFSMADLRARLLPLDLLPAALIDEINERALDLTGDIALEESDDEIIVAREVLAVVVKTME